MSTVVLGPGLREKIYYQISQAELIANKTQYLIAPMSGFFKKMSIIVNTAITTGGTITPETVPAVFNGQNYLDMTSFDGTVTGDTLVAGTGALGAVAGMQATLANGAALGTIVTTTPTLGDPSTAVVAGQAIELVLAGFAGAGEVNLVLEFDTECGDNSSVG